MLRNDIGDPGAVPNNTQPQVFATNLPGGLGYLAVYNDTPYAIDIEIPNGTFRVSSGVARLIATGDHVTNTGTWAVVASIAPSQTLYSDLYVEAYGPSEEIVESYPLNIIRQQASSATVIANDFGNSGNGLELIATSGPTEDMVIEPYTTTDTNPTRTYTFKVMINGSLFTCIRFGDSTVTPEDVRVQEYLHVNGGFDTDGAKIATDGLGNFKTLANQALAGFGVPLIVIAPTKSAAITSTIQQNLATFTPPADGLYRFGGALDVANAVNGNAILFEIAYTSALDGTAHTVYLLGQLSGVNGTSLFGGVTNQANGVYGILPVTVYAKANTTITISYRDPANTPNDTVVYMLERLS